LVGHRDTASKILDLLERDYVHPASGGVYAERPESRSTHRQDLINTCQYGLAAVTAGRVSEASRAYDWLRRLWEAQPALPGRLYTSWTDDGLCTTAAEGASTWNLYTDFHTPRQQYFNPGMAAAFLGAFASASGNADASALAHEFLRLNELGGELQFDYTENTQICKYGWGLATMLEVDPRPRMLAAAIRMVNWYADSQRPDGTWVPSSFLVASPDDADALGKTAEHLMHISAMLRALQPYAPKAMSGSDGPTQARE
jgi:hypothetical protein